MRMFNFRLAVRETRALCTALVRDGQIPAPLSKLSEILIRSRHVKLTFCDLKPHWTLTMTIRRSIQKMFNEIRNYSGNFGDPIVEHIDFSPLEVLRSADHELAIGAGIALLVEFQNHSDNATYEDALEGKEADNIRTALSENLCLGYPSIELALNAALLSEESFKEALVKVYRDYIKAS